MDRRDFLKKSVAGSAAMAAMAFEERALLAEQGEVKTGPNTAVSTGQVPCGKIGNLTISRLICGGNLFNGYAHSRDLMYVSELLQNYFTDDKIIETLEICEESGINTCVGSSQRDRNRFEALSRYWKERGGKIQWLAQVNPTEKDLTSNIKMALDNGAAGAFVVGNTCDEWARGGKVDLLGKCVDFIRQNAVVAGIGGHMLNTVQTCEKAGIRPDFYMKTLHGTNYWSKRMPGQDKEVIDNYKVDNYWDKDPEQTIAFMKDVKAAWLAYKVLAAGAIHPSEGFKHAFENGADFAVVGMFDFQVREDAAIAAKVLGGLQGRTRPWCS